MVEGFFRIRTRNRTAQKCDYCDPQPQESEQPKASLLPLHLLLHFRRVEALVDPKKKKLWLQKLQFANPEAMDEESGRPIRIMSFVSEDQVSNLAQSQTRASFFFFFSRIRELCII